MVRNCVCLCVTFLENRFMRITVGVASILAFVLGSSLQPCSAGLITYNFGGTITSVNQSGATAAGGPYDVSVGQSFTGTFSYDTNTTAFSSFSNGNNFADPLARISVTIGSTTFGESFLSFSGVPYTSQQVDYDIPNGVGNGQYLNYFTMQRNSVSVSNGIQSSAGIDLFLQNLSSTPLGILPSSGLPTTLNLADFHDLSLLNLNETVQKNLNSTTTSNFQLQGHVTSLSVASTPNAVPEPSSFALLGFGGIGLAIATYRRRRMTAA